MQNYSLLMSVKADAALVLLCEATGKKASHLVDELLSKANFDKLPVTPRQTTKTRCYSLFTEHVEALDALAQRHQGRTKTEIVEAIIDAECA